MLVRPPLSNSIVRRSAFTLMEVLVVVAIIVILASVGTIATLKFLEDAKEDQAIMQMQNMETVLKSWQMKNSGQELDPANISVLADGLDKQQAALYSPFDGNPPYQLRYIPVTNSQGETYNRPQFFVVNPKNQKEIVWPRN